ncbi:transporter [Spartinivicinus ruber]|uniref:transporter n=1 Tax=Spartinivicinus ruber TaxID=2683272 RepID=UPI0013D07C0A|nr:transporter [Spartinivicinus ruber]
MKILGPLIYSLIAAFGNALFATGQKKAAYLDNTLIFIAVSGWFFVILVTLAAPLFGSSNYLEIVKSSWQWALLSGIGLLLTCVGFHFLYTKYGASNYVLYATLSIVTTSLVVGILIFKESFNFFHWLACIFSLLAIIFFSLGNISISDHF